MLWMMYQHSGCTDDRLRESAERGAEVIVLPLEATRLAVSSAIDRIAKLGLRAWGWISVGRDEEAASLHPEWLHTPLATVWLDTFPGFPRTPLPRIAPYLCVNNAEVFSWGVQKVWRLANAYPGLEGILLADIQGAPSGCGCGSVLCRAFDRSPGPKVAPPAELRPEDCYSRLFLEACRDACPAVLLSPALWIRDARSKPVPHCESEKFGYFEWIRAAFAVEATAAFLDAPRGDARLCLPEGDGRLVLNDSADFSWHPVSPD